MPVKLQKCPWKNTNIFFSWKSMFFQRFFRWFFHSLNKIPFSVWLSAKSPRPVRLYSSYQIFWIIIEHLPILDIMDSVKVITFPIRIKHWPPKSKMLSLSRFFFFMLLFGPIFRASNFSFERGNPSVTFRCQERSVRSQKGRWRGIK